MLSFDEFKFKLTEGHKGPHWMNAYVDRHGSYWIQGNNGLGSSYYSQLIDEHPFIQFIQEMLANGSIIDEEYEFHDEVGIDLAQLVPLTNSKLYKQLTSKESKEAADKLFEATSKGLDDSYSDDSL